MKKVVRIFIMLLLPLVANAHNFKYDGILYTKGTDELNPCQKVQLIYEKDYTNCKQSDIIGYGYWEPQSVIATKEGIAIYNPELSPYIENPQVQVLDNASLNERSYLIRIIAQIPSDGTLLVTLCGGADSFDYYVDVVANNTPQIIDVFISEFPYYCEDAFVRLGFGYIEGTTIIKKAQIFETHSGDLQSSPFNFNGIDYDIIGVGLVEAISADNNLKQAEIPDNFYSNGAYYQVMSIGENAFVDCENLSALYSYAIDPIPIKGESAFENVDKERCVLYVPSGCVEKYQTAYVWSQFANIREMGSTSIDARTSDTGLFDVYTIYGYKIRSKVYSIDDLPKGLYIINGKKMIK